MKEKIMCLISIFVIAFSPALSAEKTIDQEIADLENKLPMVTGKEKVDTLNKIANAYVHISAEQCVRYGTRALKLAQELQYPRGEAAAYTNIAIGSTILGQTDKARESFEKALEIFENSGYRDGVAKALNNLGSFYRRVSNYKKALEFYLKVLEIEEEIGRKSGTAITLENIGRVYAVLGKYDKSLEFQLKGLKIKEELGDKTKIANSLYSIGTLYLGMGNNNKGLEYIQKAINIYEKQGNKQGVCNSLMVIGVVHTNLKKYDSAQEYFQKSLEMAEELRDKRGISYALSNIGSIHEKLEDYQKALEYFNKSYKIKKETGDKGGMVSTFISLGNIYTKLRQYGKALENLEQALRIGKEIKSKEPLKQSYEKLSQLYAAKGDHKKALEYYRFFHQTKEEILSEKSSRQINELQERYEAEKRAQEIEMLKKNNEIQQLRLSHEKITRYGLIIGLILVLIIFALVFKKYLYLFAFWKKQKYIGRFRLMDKIASGGIGTIFKAHSIHDKSDFAAVKILRDEFFTDATNKKRFKREAAIIDRLEHPNIIKILERGESKQTLFIAMEYLEGKTLEHKIDEEGPLPLQESLDIMVQISDAIAFIHSKNIIHRDLKPANIMLIEKDGNPNFVKLLDFGLAKMELETRLTQSGNLMGTLQYLAPEQVLDGQSAPTNDIFSMGVTCYYILSGKNPFAGETAIDIMRQIIIKEPTRVSELRPDIPGDLDKLVMQMMNKEPGERPSAKSIQDKLQYLKEKKVT